MQTVRAKFYCHAVEKLENWNKSEGQPPFLYTAKMRPVMSSGGSEENKRFWSATPSGELTMMSILVDAFEPGKHYYLDFTEAPK
jgi:hypothetical protein